MKILLLSFALLFCSTTLLFAKGAEDYNLTPQKTLPTSPSYVFKRLNEKTGMIFKFSQKSKYSYSLVLLDKRLSELATLVNDKNPDLIVSSSQRFSYQAGTTTNINSKLKEKQNVILNFLFNRYGKILTELRDNYPSNTTNWLLMSQNIDTLNILLAEMK